MSATTKKDTAQLISFPAFKDSRGELCFVQSGAPPLPFDPKRVFWIYGVPEGQQRGCHAHRTCAELVFAVNGSVKITTIDRGEQKAYILNDPTEGLFIPPMVWCQLEDFSDNCVCVCLASEAYDTDGYINDLSKFKKELGL